MDMTIFISDQLIRDEMVGAVNHLLSERVTMAQGDSAVDLPILLIGNEKLDPWRMELQFNEIALQVMLLTGDARLKLIKSLKNKAVSID
jgi:hypothetical protein